MDGEFELDLGGGCDIDDAVEGGAVVGDGLADHADVQVEADAGDVAGLLAAEEVAGAADLQVLHGDVHA
ncbi:hypothetical protein CLM83_31420, partial [Streptomyces albidoflavus]|uniref:hypothetical protein n=1 Tax=Streptomyces albidoflavus TaxID=1886 RepID=UPI000BD2A765